MNTPPGPASSPLVSKTQPALLALPEQALQSIVDALRVEDALTVGRVHPLLREKTLQHPLLRVPLAWADPGLCAIPKMAARKLADMPKNERETYLARPYFATRPDEHQVSRYGALYPYLSQPLESITKSHTQSPHERIDSLLHMREAYASRLDVLGDGHKAVQQNRLQWLSREDQASILKRPPDVPYSTSTLARMASLLLEAGASPRADMHIFEGLLEPLDGHLFSPFCDIAEGGGSCPLPTLLRDLHTGDPVDHVLRVVTQRQFEADPRLVRRVWNRVQGDPVSIFKVIHQGLDPMTPALAANETLADHLLELDLMWEEESKEDGYAQAPLWPASSLLSWHVLRSCGFDVETPLAGRAFGGGDDEEAGPLLTYRDMLENVYPLLGPLLLPPSEFSRTVEDMAEGLLERVQKADALLDAIAAEEEIAPLPDVRDSEFAD